MLREILPSVIYENLSLLPLDSINEIRLRVGSLVVVNVGGVNNFLTYSGLSKKASEGLIVRSANIDYILQKVSNNSLYTINDQLINGYITFNGFRLGVSGELVVVDGKIKTIKNITSINIRLPHVVKNCCLPVYNFIVEGGIKNTLIISPPGAGKTTFIRDLAYQINTHESNQNILIVDERNEISSIYDKEYLKGIDVYKNCSKEFAFGNGIRSMNPSVIITDEIDVCRDLYSIENAITSGVKVIATLHAKDINDLRNKKSFKEMLDKEMWERIVVLGTSNGYGTIEGVYNQHLRCIYV